MRDSFGSFLVVKGLIKIVQCLEFFFRAQRERNFLPLNPKSWGSIVKNARICKGFSSSLERFSVSPVLHLCSDYCQRVKLRCFPRHLLHTLTKTHAVTRTHAHTYTKLHLHVFGYFWLLVWERFSSCNLI